MTAKQKKQVSKILEVLSRQRFADFYEGDTSLFGTWISRYFQGEAQKKLQKEVEEKIAELFESVIKGI